MCPWFCGHVHKSVDIIQTQTSSAKLQLCIHVKVLTMAASYAILFSIMAQKIQMEDACTHTCIFEHISSCSIAHISMTHRSTNMCHRYIYMTAVNVHRSKLRKTSVLKLLQDKNQLLKKTQTLVIVPTYSHQLLLLVKLFLIVKQKFILSDWRPFYRRNGTPHTRMHFPISEQECKYA